MPVRYAAISPTPTPFFPSLAFACVFLLHLHSVSTVLRPTAICIKHFFPVIANFFSPVFICIYAAILAKSLVWKSSSSQNENGKKTRTTQLAWPIQLREGHVSNYATACWPRQTMSCDRKKTSSGFNLDGEHSARHHSNIFPLTFCEWFAVRKKLVHRIGYCNM